MLDIRRTRQRNKISGLGRQAQATPSLGESPFRCIARASASSPVLRGALPAQDPVTKQRRELASSLQGGPYSGPNLSSSPTAHIPLLPASGLAAVTELRAPQTAPPCLLRTPTCTYSRPLKTASPQTGLLLLVYSSVPHPNTRPGAQAKSLGWFSSPSCSYPASVHQQPPLAVPSKSPKVIQLPSSPPSLLPQPHHL